MWFLRTECARASTCTLLQHRSDDDTVLSRIGAMTVARITTPCQVNYIHCYRCPSVPSILYGGKTGVVGSRVSRCRSPLTPGKFAVMVWKAPGVIPRRPESFQTPGSGPSTPTDTVSMPGGSIGRSGPGRHRMGTWWTLDVCLGTVYYWLSYLCPMVPSMSVGINRSNVNWEFGKWFLARMVI